MFQEDTTPHTAVETAGMSKTMGIVLAVAIAVVAIGGFLWVNQGQSQLNQKLDQQLAALQQQSQQQATSIAALEEKLHMSDTELAKLNTTASDVQHRVSVAQAQLADNQKQTLTLAQQQQQAASEIASVKQDTGTQFGAINGQLTGVKGDVSTAQQNITKTQADLDATKASLKSTMGDLGVQSGLIATTRNELDALEKSGQRSYYEFKLTKTKEPVKVGPVQLKLKSADAKHGKYSFDLTADDTTITKKDKTLNEPVQFYVGSNHALNELVVYQIGKDQITGYLSAPKYPGQNPIPGN